VLIFLGVAWLACHAAAEETPLPPCQVVISVRDQKLAVVRDGELVDRYPISTSRFGTGDNFSSYKTPLGELRVCDKIGEDLSPGAVIRHRSATGEVLPVNVPGRDPIVTRVIWLDGLEPQNRNARSRGIYIHGTPEERTIGMPTSWGCIRMRSKDVIKVFDELPIGAVVSIIPDKLPHMHRYEPPKPQPAAVNQPPPTPIPSPAAAIQAPPPKMPAVEVVPHETAAPAPAPKMPAVKIVPRETPPPLPPLFGQARMATPPPRRNFSMPPAVAEGPERSDTAELRSMKTSILLANLPGGDPGKPEQHSADKTAPGDQ